MGEFIPHLHFMCAAFKSWKVNSLLKHREFNFYMKENLLFDFFENLICQSKYLSEKSDFQRNQEFHQQLDDSEEDPNLLIIKKIYLRPED